MNLEIVLAQIVMIAAAQLAERHVHQCGTWFVASTARNQLFRHYIVDVHVDLRAHPTGDPTRWN